MKKIVTILILLMMFSITGCTVTTDTKSDVTKQESNTVQQTSKAEETTVEETTVEETTVEETTVEGIGTIGDYSIEILGFELSKDYQDKDCIVVNYKYTNNGEEAKSFMVAVSTKAFQDGVELSSAIITGISEDSMKDIKTGASLEVKKAYSLSNMDSPVEVEVDKLFSINSNDKKVTKTFEIK